MGFMPKVLSNQRGAFSPFMFGMLMGVTVLSSLMQHWAKKELERIEQERQEIASESAEDVKRAIENKILTENIDSGEGYNTFFDINNLKGNLGASTGQTRSGQDIQITTTSSSGRYNDTSQRIVISASDDAFERQKAADQSDLSGVEAVTVIDTTDIRQQQIERSKEHLEMEASQLFRYYISNEYKFPTGSEYKLFNDKTGLKDVWGQNFKYEKKNNKKAKISFTTPWGYTFAKSLSME